MRRAFERLAPADQEAFYLHTRHALGIADLSTVLGESARRVQNRLARGRSWLAKALPESEPFALIDLHDTPAPPRELRTRVLHAGSDPELAGYRADIVARAGGLTPDGFPTQPGSRLPFVRRWILAGSSLSLAVTAAVVLLILAGTTGYDGTAPWPFEFGPRPQPSRSIPSTGNPRPPPSPPITRGPDRGRRSVAPVPPSRSRPTATASPSPRPIRLFVRPDEIQFFGPVEEGKIHLRAENGPISWTARDTGPTVFLSKVRGTVPANKEEIVVVTFKRALIQLPGTATITIRDETGRKQTIEVSWNASLL